MNIECNLPFPWCNSCPAINLGTEQMYANFAVYETNHYCKNSAICEKNNDARVEYEREHPAPETKERTIWNPVGRPPAKSGRYNVLCDEWGGWKSRTVSFLASGNVWIDDCGRDITKCVVFWKDFPEHPKEEEDHA